MIPYGKQDINQFDIDAVVEVLKSDFLTQGPKVAEFEDAVARAVDAQFAIAVNSATSALHIACLALGVKKGDLVWTSPITFVASANCALYCDAEIDFVDVEPTTGNLCAQAFKNKLEHAKLLGRLPKVVIPVHLAGHSCDMQRISELAKQYQVKIIEDASHAIGGHFQGNKIGSCHFSDITVFSFHPVKVITTAEGGMLTTQDSELAATLNLLRSHGITRELSQLTRPNEGDWYYEQHILGFNYRMSDLQAALGLSQIKRLESFVERRNQFAKYYEKVLKNLNIGFIKPLENCRSAYHLFIIRLPEDKDRKSIFNLMRQAGIGVHVHYFPVYLQPFYIKKGYFSGYCPGAENYYANCLTIPIFTQMKEKEQDFILKKLHDIIFDIN
ncbi:UDP-4-amino-4,6-dideoxy-N-acetyl-beta-L-altrosamine transaminase [Shewanella morhuae]|uniref:UDP-4-amino-4, 6-dideoxy-N-acetyl-beta-L-altrosamine transaminase n=1 Tax=Shewanella morhuae TaxID=365591 RepID=A0ABX5HXP6_9GAMM|nr:UDP-4-amino-4,6-dideoxy-N-acetyl-beta-L-altrosamine transaminase [Shewanella morhuae]PTA50817.1 UDP-4-amino-4,6-dideoxy-N-acetyl-beta-L-altrosamine transaminase [Shewanella morhuae]